MTTLATVSRAFVSEPQARTRGIQEANSWLNANRGAAVERQKMVQSEQDLAEAANQRSAELVADDPAEAKQQFYIAAYHQAKADRLASFSRGDLGGRHMSNQPRRWTIPRLGGQQQSFIGPALTVVAVVVICHQLGIPLWLSLILSGIGARIVAQRAQSTKWTARLWGIVPTLPMLLGYYWAPALAAVVHILLWRHPSEQTPRAQEPQGENNFPREV